VFVWCTSLTSIVIPDSVKSIGAYAFYKCISATIYCEAESQPDGWDSNWNYSKCPVVWGYKGSKTNESFQKLINAKYKLKEDFNTDNIIAYHGSNAKFNKFDMKYFGRTDDGMWGKGIYFISDKRVAQSFGSDYLYTCRLKLNKPYIIEMSTVGNNEDSEDSSKYYSLTNRDNNVLKRKGYDSIIVKDELWEGSFTTRANEYIVFDPSDIEIVDVKDLSLEEAYHFGNLEYGRKADKRGIMAGRGTGHFGTGFYTIGSVTDDTDYNGRELWEIDLTKYNLFKPRNNNAGYTLHDTLKKLNGLLYQYKYNGYTPDIFKLKPYDLRIKLDDFEYKYGNEGIIKFIDSYFPAYREEVDREINMGRWGAAE
jgi:hypothetical protein